jgi:alanyl-tRNA synthetase
VEGELLFGPCAARVPRARRRDTERNHTATHLLHAALRKVLGEHVHQAGSVVEPDRLRFDFTHHGPIKPEQLEEIERWVNDAIWANVDVTTTERKYADAVALGAMALFGEKYGDVVRVVDVPGISRELCGGTHVRNTGQISLMRIVTEQGVAAGVRRIVAITGPKAFESLREKERALESVGDKLKVNVHAAGIEAIGKRLDALLGEKRTLEKKLDEALRGSGGGSAVQAIVGGAESVKGARVAISMAEAADVEALKTVGDAVREAMPDGVAVLGAVTDGKGTLLVVVGEVLRGRGLSAGGLVKDIAALAGGRGGGKPHMAQAGLADEGALKTALSGARAVVEKALG